MTMSCDYFRRRSSHSGTRVLKTEQLYNDIPMKPKIDDDNEEDDFVEVNNITTTKFNSGLNNKDQSG